MSAPFVGDLIRNRRIVVCVGAGGVGKTTTAAALGLAGAAAGRRVTLLTIDPANRLADALGLPPLCGVATAVPLADDVPGRLTALRLDTRATFDGLVRRLAPSPSVADTVLGNRLYANIADNLAASTSYMAVEKLFELAHDEGTDLLILDTPPTAHALDFLDAPRRILDVLNSRALAILQNPATILTSTGSRVSHFVLGTILRVLEEFTGLTLLRDVAEFVRGFEGMVDGLRTRATSVERLLRAPGTAFVLVTAPNSLAVSRTEEFFHTLAAAGIPCAGLIVNRVLPRALFDREPPPLTAAAHTDVPPVLADKLARTFADLHALAAAEYQSIERLRARLRLGTGLAEVPAFPGDLASLDAVEQFARHLVADGRGPMPRKASE